MDSPISHPTIEIGGVHYAVKFDNLALYRLSKGGTNMNFTDGRMRYEQTLEIASAAIQREPRFTPEELSQHFGPFGGARPTQVLADVLNQAMEKAQPVTPPVNQPPAGRAHSKPQ